MGEETPASVDLYQRKVVFSSYSGPNSGLGEAVQMVYSWVGTYYSDRISDVTVCFAQRPTRETVGDKSRFIEAEVQFEVEDFLPEETKLPPDMEMKQLGEESLLCRTFRGALLEIMPKTLDWMEAMERENKIADGYRQRFLVMAGSPDDPSWELEIQLVLA